METPILNPPHWNYYELLERDLQACFRFVEPVECHHEVYSIEFARIILAAATEIENAFRGFAHTISYTPEPSSIGAYAACVTSRFPRFADMQILMRKYSIVLTPWEGFTVSTPPDWWTYGYNKIKHDRLQFPGAPTLIRAINAVAALQVLLLHYYRVKYPGGLLAFDPVTLLMIPLERNDPLQGVDSMWGWTLPDEEREETN